MDTAVATVVELIGTPAGGADALPYHRPYIQNIPH